MVEVIDIIVFMFYVVMVVVIENLIFVIDFSDKFYSGFLFCDVDIWVIIVIKNVDIKVFGIFGGFYWFLCCM